MLELQAAMCNKTSCGRQAVRQEHPGQPVEVGEVRYVVAREDQRLEVNQTLGDSWVDAGDSVVAGRAHISATRVLLRGGPTIRAESLIEAAEGSCRV